ncbi:NAD+ synthase [Skermanella stibiiresistens]|uniref:NAD+ synthase n=1 Tax=Skermanella stibiiresistens TaxID=913326 RepID=UPI0004BA98C7|nr:NAD+ synthase [Skermanella stibiiresistens]
MTDRPLTDHLAIALAQLNPTVGAIERNLDLIRGARAEAYARGADLVVCPAMSVTGQPVGQLASKPFFLDAVASLVRDFAEETADGGPGVLVGAPWRIEGRVHNAVLLLDGGRIVTARAKHVLLDGFPFDERHLFAAGPVPGPVNFRGVRLGVLIAEDMSTPDVAEALGECGAEILVVAGGDAVDVDSEDRRINLAVARVGETGLPLLSVNQIGGHDQLVYDGASFVLGADNRLRLQAPAFRDSLLVSRWQAGADEVWVCAEGELAAPPVGLAAMYHALMLGLGDHVRKSGAAGVLVGLTDGVDSALTAALAVDALGSDRVHCVLLPSPGTSRQALEDAREIAELLGCKIDEIPIEPALRATNAMLAPAFAGRDPDRAEDDLRSTLRGAILLALSAKFGALTLSAANRTDMAVGRATLHGDLWGGFAVLKDVYRTTVVALANWRNRHLPEGAHGPAGRVVPERVVTDMSDVEPRPGTTGARILPPADVLDDILRCLIDKDVGLEEIVARDHDPAVVEQVWRTVAEAEGQRRQLPPGVRITSRSFGASVRLPVVNGFATLP